MAGWRPILELSMNPKELFEYEEMLSKDKTRWSILGSRTLGKDTIHFYLVSGKPLTIIEHASLGNGKEEEVHQP